MCDVGLEIASSKRHKVISTEKEQLLTVVTGTKKE